MYDTISLAVCIKHEVGFKLQKSQNVIPKICIKSPKKRPDNPYKKLPDNPKTRAETAQTMANSEVHEKSSESHEKFMRKSGERQEKVKRKS